MCLVLNILFIRSLIMTLIESWCSCCWIHIWAIRCWGYLGLRITASNIAAWGWLHLASVSIIMTIIFAAVWWITVILTIVFINIKSILMPLANVYSLQSRWWLLIVVRASLIYISISFWEPLVWVYYLVLLMRGNIRLVLVLEESSDVIVWRIVWKFTSFWFPFTVLIGIFLLVLLISRLSSILILLSRIVTNRFLKCVCIWIWLC